MADGPGAPKLARRIVLVLVLAAAAALRFAGLGFGAPADRVRWDEAFALTEAIALVQGDPHVHFHNYPPGLIHAYALVLRACRALGVCPAPDFASFAADPNAFYAVGRALSAVLGTLTVAAVWLAFRRRHAWGAVFAAAVAASSPLHALHSHFATLDAPGTFFVALTLLVAGVAAARPALAWLWPAAGACAGLAAALKYPHGAVLLAPLVLAATGTNRLRDPVLCVAGSVAGFLLGAPEVLGELAPIRAGIVNEYASQAARRALWTGEHPALFHLRLTLTAGIGFGPCLLALLGAWRGIRLRDRWVIAVALPALVLFVVHGWSGAVFARYLLPLVPAVALLAGAGIAAVARRAPRRAALLAVAVLALPLVRSAEQAAALSRTDTRALFVEALRLGALPADLPILVPYPFLPFVPAADPKRLLWQPAEAFGCEVRRALIEDAHAKLRASGPPRLDLRVYDGGDALAALASQAPEFLIVFIDGFHEYDRWVPPLRERTLALASQAGVDCRRVAAFTSRNPGEPAPPSDAYDRSDSWYVPLAAPEAAGRPGPDIEVYRVRRR